MILTYLASGGKCFEHIPMCGVKRRIMLGRAASHFSFSLSTIKCHFLGDRIVVCFCRSYEKDRHRIELSSEKDRHRMIRIEILSASNE